VTHNTQRALLLKLAILTKHLPNLAEQVFKSHFSDCYISINRLNSLQITQLRIGPVEELLDNFSVFPAQTKEI